MSNFTERMKEAAGHLEKARGIMAAGPLDFYLNKLAEHSEALTTRFAPIKCGERAMIIKHVECNNGWDGCEKHLCIGSVGEVHSVDYYDGRFVFEFVPDKQFWRDDKGVYHKCNRLHSYGLSEAYLKKCEPGEVRT